MNEYEITHTPCENTRTPKVGPVKESNVGMMPKHDRGLCAICQFHNCHNCWNNPHNLAKIPVVTAAI